MTPHWTSASPAITIAVTLAGGAVPLTSSHSPTGTITTAAAISRAARSSANSGSNRSSSRAVANATMNPMNIARPPIAGIGSVCTVRSFGWYTQSKRCAIRPTIGVTRNVTTAATAPMMR